MKYEPIGTTAEDLEILAQNVSQMSDAEVETYLYGSEFTTTSDAIELAEYTGELMDERGLL